MRLATTGFAPGCPPPYRSETACVQESENQLALLDTFFGALRPEEFALIRLR